MNPWTNVVAEENQVEETENQIRKIWKVQRTVAINFNRKQKKTYINN